MVFTHAVQEVRDFSRSSSGTSRTCRSWANMSGACAYAVPRFVSAAVDTSCS
jgi:hypothetical protein